MDFFQSINNCSKLFPQVLQQLQVLDLLKVQSLEYFLTLLILGDIIIELDGKEIKRLDDLFAVLDRHKVGDTISGVLLRAADSEDKEKIEFTVTLQDID